MEDGTACDVAYEASWMARRGTIMRADKKGDNRASGAANPLQSCFEMHEVGLSGYALCGSPYGRLNYLGDERVTCAECIARTSPRVEEEKAIMSKSDQIKLITTELAAAEAQVAVLTQRLKDLIPAPGDRVRVISLSPNADATCGILIDPNCHYAKRINTWAYPHYLWLDANGKIRANLVSSTQLEVIK